MTGLQDITVSATFNMSEIKLALRQWGVAVLPGYAASCIEALRSDWERMRYRGHSAEEQCIDRVGSDLVDYAALFYKRPGGRQFQAVCDFFLQDSFRELAFDVLGAPAAFNEEIYATFDLGGDSEVAPPHFDKLWNLKFMVYLEDILEEGFGNFAIYPGSQSLARAHFRQWFDCSQEKNIITVGSDAYYNMTNSVLPEGLRPVVNILAPAGTLIIFNTDVYHRGSFLAKGNVRRILRAHSAPGPRFAKGNDVVRKFSRYWDRGERWEQQGKTYSCFSLRGLKEWNDFRR